MMKDEVRISMINLCDTEIDTLHEYHKLICKDTQLNGHLIYYDSNFQFYLKKIIKESDKDKFFKLKVNDKNEGFLHLKTLDDAIFLNNIFVSSNIRGRGIGKYFLHKSLNKVKNKNLKYFYLDVFYSNKRVLNWYKKIGLSTISKTGWFKINGNTIALSKNQAELTFKRDENGFNSFYKDDKKVGTIANSTLLVNDLFYINDLPLSYFEWIICNEKLNKISKKLKFQKLETSIRMKGHLHEVLNSL